MPFKDLPEGQTQYLDENGRLVDGKPIDQQKITDSYRKSSLPSNYFPDSSPDHYRSIESLNKREESLRTVLGSGDFTPYEIEQLMKEWHRLRRMFR